jgi:hypothetical protein
MWQHLCRRDAGFEVDCDRAQLARDAVGFEIDSRDESLVE